MTPDAFGGLSVVLAIGYVVLPVLVAALAVNLGLRMTRTQRLSFGDALVLVVIYGAVALFIAGLLAPAEAALGIPPAWAVPLVALVVSAAVFVALLRKRVELTVIRATGVFGVVLATLFLFALIIILPLRLLVMAPYVVRGSSMEPAFPDNVLFLADKISYRLGEPQRGDIVLVRPPYDPTVYYVKRIVGLPGEEIRFRDGAVVVVNKSHPEGFVLHEPYLGYAVRTEPWSADTTSLVVPDDAYVVLGDNREHAHDSRAWGAVGRDGIIGKAGLIVLPFDRAGAVKPPAYGRAQVEAMKREIARIDGAISEFDKQEIALNGESSEGAELTGYVEDGVLRRIDAEVYFETGRTFTTYYFAPVGAVFFMRQTRQYYDAPLTSAAPEVVGWETEQRYFSGTNEVVPSVGGDAVEVELRKDQQAFFDAAARYRAALLAT